MYISVSTCSSSLLSTQILEWQTWRRGPLWWRGDAGGWRGSMVHSSYWRAYCWACGNIPPHNPSPYEYSRTAVWNPPSHPPCGSAGSSAVPERSHCHPSPTPITKQSLSTDDPENSRVNLQQNLRTNQSICSKISERQSWSVQEEEILQEHGRDSCFPR